MDIYSKIIPTVRLSDQLTMPMIGFGTGSAMKKSKDACIDLEKVEQIKTAIHLGYRHFDTAEAYFTEKELGLALQESQIPRAEVFITSKVYYNMNDIRGAIAESLRNLQVSYLDLYLIHAPFFAKTEQQLQEAWKQMELIKDRGLTMAIGCSNCTQYHLETLLKSAKVRPAVNQIEFHAYLQRGTLVEWSRRHNILTVAYGVLVPLTKGRPGPIDDLIKALAQSYNVNEEQIMIRWCLQQGIAVLTTSTRQKRLSDIVHVSDFSLTTREIQQIQLAGSEKHFRSLWNNIYSPEDRT